MADMQDVVAKLAELTEKGQVPWKSTVDKSAFAATFGKMSVLISSREPFTELASTYSLAVLDEQGNEIDSATASHNPASLDDPPVLARLYITAKRSAVGVDERLEELLRAMDVVAGS